MTEKGFVTLCAIVLLSGIAWTAVAAYRQTCPNLSRHLPNTIATYDCTRRGVFPETRYTLRTTTDRDTFLTYVATLQEAYPSPDWEPLKLKENWVATSLHENGRHLIVFWLSGEVEAEWHLY